MKKMMTVTSMMLAGALLLSACASNGNTNTGGTAGTNGAVESSSEGGKEAASNPQTLTVSYNQGEFSWPVYEQLAAAFKERTGHTVKFNYVPAQEYDNWVQTQFIGGTEPDVIMGGGELDQKKEFYRNGWIVDLEPYLDEESPFTGKPWRASFQDGVLDSVLDKTDSADPKLYGAPDQLVTVNLYYNKAIFEEIGVSEPPANVTELLETAKKAQEAGYIGFSIQNSIDWNLGWYASDLWDALWRSSLDELDLNSSGEIETSEWAAAVKAGKLTAQSPQLQEYARLMKDLSAYFNTGFNTASWEFEGLFNEGKSAMTLNGSWYPNQHLQGSFAVDYGVAPVPYLDNGYSELGYDKAHHYLIGSSPALSVTRSAEKNGKLDAAVDFIRFWTAPDGGAKILAEGLYQIPVVKDVQVPDVLQPIVAGFGSERRLTFTANNFTAEQKDTWFKGQQAFLDGKLTADEWLQGFAKDMEKYADQAIAANPEWKLQ